jgi:hypothetical protein
MWDSLSAVQWAAAISTLVLTAGAIIEYWHKILLLLRLTWRTLTFRATPFEKCTLRKVLTHSVGPILVVLGIGGELIFESRAFILEDILAAKSANTIATLQADLAKAASDARGAEYAAHQAQDSAKEAKAAAGEAKNKADATSAVASEADRTASGAITVAGDARRAVGVLDNQTKRASDQLGQLTADLGREEELNALNAPRLFRNQDEAAERWNKFPRLIHIQLEYLVENEAKRTAEQIAFVLNKAGLEYVPAPRPVDQDMPDGVTVYLNAVAWRNMTQHHAALMNSIAGGVIDELTRDGIKAVRGGSFNNWDDPSQLFIKVGTKPNPTEQNINSPISSHLTGLRITLPLK